MNSTANHSIPSHAKAVALLNQEGMAAFDLLVQAGKLREERFGKTVSICAIINAKSGGCPENCAFCAQSHAADTKVTTYPLQDESTILENARQAKQHGAKSFSIVTSGTTIKTERELETIASCVRGIAEMGLSPCASIGLLNRDQLSHLKDAGLLRVHHNLETARSYFSQICTTHEYDDDIETIRQAKDLGLMVCSGGILGMGESLDQRVELAETLAELKVESIALNFLNPIPGTKVHQRLEGKSDLTPLACLKAIAVFRLLNPTADVTICGGREVNLRDLQALVFMAGANRLMSGNYLTTQGRNFEMDRRMIADLGLELDDVC